jgi:magnesium transporter
MLRTVFATEHPKFCWLDLVEPSKADLEEVVRRYGLYPTAVADCMDPEHLPKVERYDGTSFVILRAIDEKAGPGAVSVQALTRKVAIFFGPEFLITIHRKDQDYLQKLQAEWSARYSGPNPPAQPMPDLLIDIMNAAIETYEKPLEEAETQMDKFEAGLFRTQRVTLILREIYLLKRRVTLAKRMLWKMVSTATRLGTGAERGSTLFQDLRENAESMHFYADELLEDVNNLLHMQLSLASHRGNEVMRVLTIFSAFFLPLTFLVGVYGMNFKYMPELTKTWGYPMVLALMILIALAIFVWFRRKGWL